ncbi:VanZ family protein [Heyndrickxia acidicola]|uniref:VanZ family protein n=1 Tax=Heyndrickxia acidicola TaxID=209389 RepID=A0ABU6MAT0_9BACI|nr:VanZ family protein [Heyndrickxia acidicola]MED1201776.1 VanZ family protein [Heyndrickxia acidicola]
MPQMILKKHRNRKMLGLKWAMILLWGLVLCINTFTENLESLMSFQSVGFHWNWEPDYLSFFNMNDLTTIDPDFILVKTGHFMGFAIMDLLIYNLTRSHKRSILFSMIFAFMTEFFQLFFGRDGRLYDMCIDSIGIWCVYFLLKWGQTIKQAKD